MFLRQNCLFFIAHETYLLLRGEGSAFGTINQPPPVGAGK